jgi:pimeloyl-ACP methyl ester carboxylesterase
MRPGSWLRMALCVLMVASTLAGPGTAALAAPAAHTQAGDDCDAAEVPSLVNQSVSGSVAVLFVHGLDSSPAIWDEGPDPITRQVAGLQGVTAWTYDYSKVAVQWVTDPQIGLGLAGAITCLAQATGKQVIVVAHSMGGLATEWAVNQVGTDGVPVASHVAKVITIGTPTKGSLSGAIAVEGTAGIEAAVSLLGGTAGKALVAGVEAARSACAGEIIRDPQKDFCLWFGLDETPAGKALLYGSPELAALPPWPASVPVVAMAGDFGETVSVGRISFSNVPLGDLVVSLGSATAYYTSGSPFIVTCPRVSLLDLIRYHNDELCYHHNLPRNPQIEGAVVEQIKQALPPTLTQPSVNENSNASPVVGPDGRLWFSIAEQPNNAELGALNPATGKLQTYQLTYTPPGGGTINYQGPIAFDGAGNVWLSAQDQPPGGSSAPPPVLIRYTPATHATAQFPMPMACADITDGLFWPVAASDGSVWLDCGSVLFRISSNGTTTGISLPSFFTVTGALAEGPDGTMYASATKDGISGIAEISASSTPTFYPGPGGAGIGAIAGNGTGTLIAQVGCSELVGCAGVPAHCDQASTSCFYELSSGGTLSLIAEVPDITQLYQTGMGSHGDLWAVAELGQNQSEDLLEVTPAGHYSLYQISNASLQSFTPVGAPAITSDGSVWIASQQFAQGLLQIGPFSVP